MNMNGNNMDFLLGELQSQNPSLQRLLQEQQQDPAPSDSTRPPVEQACTTLFEDIEEGAAIWQQRPSQTLLSQQFQNTPAINAAHNGIPRGGNTNDILVLAQYGAEAQSQENEDLVKSYVVGLLVASIMIMLFFIVWMVLLVVLKGFGPKRVGFLSGKRQKIPPRPNKSKPNGKSSTSSEGKGEEGRGAKEGAEASKDEAFANPQDDFEAAAQGGDAADAAEDKADDDVDHNADDDDDDDDVDIDIDYTSNIVEKQWDAYYHNKITQQRWMKLIVGVCCAVIIAMAIVMSVRGIESLRGSVKDGSQSINYAGDIMEAAAGSVAGLAAYLEAFQADMVFVLTEVNEICPAVTGGTDGDGDGEGGICQNISDPSTCDESFVDEIFGQFIDQLELNQTALQEIVDVLNTTASTALRAAEDEFGVDVPNDEEINDFVNGVVDEVDDNINTTDVRNRIDEGNDQDAEASSDLFDEASGLISGFNFTNLVETFTQDWPIVDELYKLSDGLYRIEGATNTADERISTIEWVFYVAVVFDLLVGLLALCLIIGLVLPLPKVLRCLHNRLIFPMLCAFTMLSFIFAIAFLIASLALSDVCYDSPESNLEQFAMAAFEKTSDDLGSSFEQAVSSGDVDAIEDLDWSDYIPQFVTFWLSKCDAEPEGPERDLAQLDEARRWLSAFQVILTTYLDQAAAGICGTPDPGIYSQIFDTMSGYLCATVSGLLDLQAALSCQTWLPLYYSTVYNAMCYNGTSGVWAIAATQFMTTLMTGFILTFRAVFWELEIEGDEEEEDEEEKKETSKKSGLFSRFRKNKDDDGVVDEDEKNKNDVDDLALAEDEEEKETAPAIATTNTEEKYV
mmetsp:Transcript_26602/g.63407  ORF Transcript_26602/g.63407 Transcript_26602/m.63407 type:complete len:850 (+) Transcript_26602:962-3511(+)